MIKNICLLLMACVLFSFKGDKKAYQLYTSEGKTVEYSELLSKAKDADIVLFGEMHDNPICHWLQLELTNNLIALKKGSIMLGAEMFEADD